MPDIGCSACTVCPISQGIGQFEIHESINETDFYFYSFIHKRKTKKRPLPWLMGQSVERHSNWMFKGGVTPEIWKLCRRFGSKLWIKYKTEGRNYLKYQFYIYLWIEFDHFRNFGILPVAGLPGTWQPCNITKKPTPPAIFDRALWNSECR